MSPARVAETDPRLACPSCGSNQVQLHYVANCLVPGHWPRCLDCKFWSTKLQDWEVERGG